MRQPSAGKSKWEWVLMLVVLSAWCGLTFQSISVSIGQSHWRRTLHGWEAAADSRPIPPIKNSSIIKNDYRQTLVFKSLGLDIDLEAAHSYHRILLPLAIAGFIGSVGFWFLLWDRRELAS